MALLPATADAQARYALLDSARGLALVAMAAFHLTWDLDYFALIPVGIATSAWFKTLGDAIAAAFLLIVGVSLALASRNTLNRAAFLRRVGIIAAAAAAITLATWIIFPDQVIFFGILHCIALSSLLAASFLRAPLWLALAVAAAALVLPWFVSSPIFDAPLWQWLGLGTHEPVSNDWRPLLPWFGFVLLGLAAGRVALAHQTGGLSAGAPRGILGRLLALGGRRSLLIYLVHQPLLLGALWLATFAAGRAPPSEAAGFARACTAHCLTQGAERPYCDRVCGCVTARAQEAPLWRSVLRGELSPQERSAFDAIAHQCVRESQSPR